MSQFLESLSFQSLFDAAADAMLISDKDGRVVKANPAAYCLLGYAPGELEGIAVSALFPERYRVYQALLREAFSRHPKQRAMDRIIELVALRRDGKELSVGGWLSPLTGQGDTFSLVTLYNIARRDQIDQALRASEERLSLAKRAAALGIFDRDLINNTLHWDDRSRELWGLGPDEVETYERFVEGIHPEDRDKRQAALDRALDPASDGEYRSEFRVISKSDGAERWIATAGRVFFDAGRPVRIVGVMQDITKHKVIEQQFYAQREEIEALSKQQVAVQTASAIAHELNQPLAAVSAYSEVALRSLQKSPQDTEPLLRVLENCVEQSQRAGRTLHELLDFLHKGELVLEPVDINSVVREAVAIAQNDGYGGFHTVLQLDRGLPPVMGNRTQIQKILLNLLRNGVEAMREARVPISAITVRVRTMAGKSMVQVTVRDNGPGVGPEVIKRIFDPFYSTKARGMGLGLAISRALAESHGGQLWVDPDEGPGAAFHFTLPISS